MASSPLPDQVAARHAREQLRERSLRSLYCCFNGVRVRVTPVTHLFHTASLRCNEGITLSNLDFKHLECAFNYYV